MEFQKNQLLTVNISDMSSEGEGVGKVDGYTFFIKDTVIGDEAQIRVTKLKKNYGYGRLEKVLTPSPFRVEPPCRFHKQCGGCQIQAISYQKQLSFKQDKVRNNIIRIGGFDEKQVNQVMEPIVGMELPFHYRNKAQYPIGTDKEGNPVAGFYAGRTHTIIANTDCLLGVEENQKILEIILNYMRKFQIAAYDETTGKGLLRHVLLRKGFTSGEIMVCLVINGKAAGSSRQQSGIYLPHQEDLVQQLSTIPGMTSISVSINSANTNVIMGNEIHTIWGKESITDTIFVRDVENDFAKTERGITFSISPLSFYQVNPAQTEKLYSIALSYADLKGNESVWDLYCGIGTISLFLSEKAGKVYGVEIVPQAIQDARENAKNNGIANTEFFVGKAEEVLPEFYDNQKEVGDEMLHPNVIVVDPPRKGCDEKCLETMLQMAPERIVYVSCDSATLARDLKMLCAGGYELKRIRAVDMFPHTVHVETVVKLSLKKDTPKIEVTMKPDEESNYTPEEKATYPKIKEYVKNKYGVNVHTSYIAQVKRMCGLDMGENYNKSKKENPEVKQCPQEKVEYIKDALKHFRLI